MPPRTPFRSSGFYAIALLGWVAMTLLAVYVAGSSAIKDADQHFRAHAADLTTELRQKLHANEAVLSAFAAFLAAVEGGDRTAAVRFTRSLLGAYPHIYMLEVARRVRAGDTRAFERRMRDSWQPDFHIRTFGYGGSRQWNAVAPKADYWPIVFMQPEFPEARAVLGLDIDSVPHLARTLELARRGESAVGTTPFRLVEGDLAHVLVQAVGRPAQRDAVRSFEGELAALLVVKASSLSPRWVAEGVGVTAHTLSGDSPGAVLFERPAPAAHWTETAMLPRLVVEADSASTAQPVHLVFERQLRWRDVNGLGLRSVAVLSLLSLALVMLYLRRHHQAMLRADEEHQRAEYLATHDPLTALPNRILFADRVRQALHRNERHGSMFALFMIDLDRFKEINDEFGHEGGDVVLTTIAARIADSLRATDTVARFGGDEFMVLIADVVGEADATGVAEKLLLTVGRPIDFNGRPIGITCSVGVALCPRDGRGLEDLMRQADRAMYRVKAGGRNGVSIAIEPA